MQHPITPTAHGVADYVSALTFVAAPSALGMSPRAATLSRSLGGSYTALSAATAYPLGVVKLIPFPTHLTLDAALGLGLAAAPWLFGFAADRAGRNFFLGMAAVTAVVTSLTQRRRAA